MSSALRQRRIVVTRPAAQADSLMAALAAEGASPVALPLLRIEPAISPEELAQATQAQASAALWIFTSVNAVIPFAELPPPLAWPGRVAAIGAATSARLASLGVNAWAPAAGSRSEDLLDDPQLGDVAGQTVVIIGGEGGRELLATRLAERGATVRRMSVYRRVPEMHAPDTLRAALQDADAIVFTSAEAMTAFQALAGTAEHDIAAADAPICLVISERLVDHAKSLGYLGSPLLASGPYDADIIRALHSHFGAVSSMSDSSSTPADPAPVAPPPKAPAVAAPMAPRAGRGAGVALFFAFLALLISAGGVAAGYWAWMQMSMARAQLQQDGAQTLRAADEAVREQRKTRDMAQQVGDQTAALQLRMEGYEEALGQLKDSIDAGRSQITLSTVEQLMLLANERLLLANDIRGADAALARADDRLERLADPRLHRVREAISRERAALTAMPRFDREGVSLALSSLIEQVQSLPLAPRTMAIPEADFSEVDLAADRPILDRLGDILRQLFVLRREGGEAAGALPESAGASIVMLLHIKLENARAAWLAGDTEAFVQTLGSAQQWTARHFAVDQPGVSSFESELQRLQRQPAAVQPPDLTRSLILLRAQLEPEAQ